MKWYTRFLPKRKQAFVDGVPVGALIASTATPAERAAGESVIRIRVEEMNQRIAELGVRSTAAHAEVGRLRAARGDKLIEAREIDTKLYALREQRDLLVGAMGFTACL